MVCSADLLAYSPDGSVLLSRHSQPGVFTTSSYGLADWDRTACPSQRSEQVGPAGMSPIGLGEGEKKDIAFCTVKIEAIQVKRKVVSFENVY